LTNSQPMLLHDQSSPFNEAVRTVRSTLLISRNGKSPQVFLVASGSPDEGKTLVALSLATSLAQTGKKVILIEADMRRPKIGQLLGLDGRASTGLSGLLSNDKATTTALPLDDNPNLYVLLAGAKPPYPAEMLSSQRFQSLLQAWKRDFDFVVIDSPPVLPVTDGQLLQEQADATILVARDGVTSQIALERTYKSLHKHAKDPEAPAIGVVLNFVSPHSATYQEYYGYRNKKQYLYAGDQDRQENA
jgi:polysaccharide biosynthesis transport protein